MGCKQALKRPFNWQFNSGFKSVQGRVHAAASNVGGFAPLAALAACQARRESPYGIQQLRRLKVYDRREFPPWDAGL
jgi:hypothetical protein